MPDAGENTYWHELPELVPPFDLNSVKRIIARASHRGSETEVHPAAPPQATTRRRTLTLDKTLSPLQAFNELLANLGATPVTAEEFVSTLEYVQSSAAANIDDSVRAAREPTLLRALRQMLDERGLRVEKMQRDHMMMRRTINASVDISPHQTGVIFVDRERPIFVTALSVKSAKNALTKSMIELLVPLQSPVPVRFRCRRIHNISHTDSILLRVSRDTDPVAPVAEVDTARDERGEALLNEALSRIPAANNPLKSRRRCKHPWYVRLLPSQTRKRQRAGLDMYN